MSLGIDDIDSLDWSKADGLIPGVVQDARSEAVLMLGFLSPESLRETFLRGRVVFYSRTRQRLWEKGETSGHFLELVSIDADCDSDSLLLRVHAAGPACHRNTLTCFGDGALPEGEGVAFLSRLDADHPGTHCRAAGRQLYGAPVRRGHTAHCAEGRRGRRGSGAGRQLRQ